MRRFKLFSALAVLLVASMALAADQMPLQYDTSVSATQANTAVSFGFSAFDVTIINDGANEVFIDLTDTVAATTDFELKAGESLKVHRLERESSSSSTWVGLTGFGVICSTGETATVRVLATRPIEE